MYGKTTTRKEYENEMRELEAALGIAKEFVRIVPTMLVSFIVSLIAIRILKEFGYYDKFKTKKRGNKNARNHNQQVSNQHLRNRR